MPGRAVEPNLCSPGNGLTCFACCPPIRPAGYEHLEHRASLRRLFSEARQDFLAGRPVKPMVGYWCGGLGFLDSAGHQVGCLYHPARHGGADQRLATGYQPKCARESCPEARAFAVLEEPARRRFLELCAGLDAFEFSSARANPARRLLALGPVVAGAGICLAASLAQLAAWTWLGQTPPAWGWLLGLWARGQGPEALLGQGLHPRLARAVGRIGQVLGPAPPLADGQPLGELCDEWEARFWRDLSGRGRARAQVLARWRRLAGQALGQDAEP